VKRTVITQFFKFSSLSHIEDLKVKLGGKNVLERAFLQGVGELWGSPS
jgi:hypothetical protein